MTIRPPAFIVAPNSTLFDASARIEESHVRPKTSHQSGTGTTFPETKTSSGTSSTSGTMIEHEHEHALLIGLRAGSGVLARLFLREPAGRVRSAHRTFRPILELVDADEGEQHRHRHRSEDDAEDAEGLDAPEDGDEDEQVVHLHPRAHQFRPQDVVGEEDDDEKAPGEQA